VEVIERIAGALRCPVWTTGREFGTIGLQIGADKVEVTRFRSEEYDPESRKPMVRAGHSIYEDLWRRDFTINAMAVDVFTGELVDPFGGHRDLEARLLRTPGPPERTVVEDPLRSLRAVRFHAVMESMELDEALGEAIARNVRRLEIVSRERKTAELVRILSAGGASVVRAAGCAERLGVTAHLFGDLEPCGDAVRRLGTIGEKMTMTDALAVFAQDVPERARAALADLRIPSAEAARALDVASVGSILRERISRSQARHLIRRYDDAVLASALRVNRDAIGADQLWGEIRAGVDAARRPLPITGYDLVTAGLSGRSVGIALRAVEARLLEDDELTREEALGVALDAVA